MYLNQHITVIIPALNEAAAIGLVLDEIPDFVDQVRPGSRPCATVLADIQKLLLDLPQQFVPVGIDDDVVPQAVARRGRLGRATRLHLHLQHRLW